MLNLSNSEYLDFIFGIVLIAVVIILLHRIDYKDIEKNLMQRCSQTTIGKIEYISKGIFFHGIKISKNRKFLSHPYSIAPNFTVSYYTVYSYYANGRQYFGIDARKQISILTAGKSGDVVQIFYNPNDAREFYCPSENINVKYGYLVIAIALIILAVIISILYIYINRLGIK